MVKHAVGWALRRDSPSSSGLLKRHESLLGLVSSVERGSLPTRVVVHAAAGTRRVPGHDTALTIGLRWLQRLELVVLDRAFQVAEFERGDPVELLLLLQLLLVLFQLSRQLLDLELLLALSLLELPVLAVLEGLLRLLLLALFLLRLHLLVNQLLLLLAGALTGLLLLNLVDLALHPHVLLLDLFQLLLLLDSGLAVTLQL